MKKINNQTDQRICSRCDKSPVSSFNRPNSLHKTKRQVYPNLQTVNDKLICTRCLKTERKLLNV